MISLLDPVIPGKLEDPHNEYEDLSEDIKMESEKYAEEELQNVN